jgi:hypothetical protein
VRAARRALRGGCGSSTSTPRRGNGGAVSGRLGVEQHRRLAVVPQLHRLAAVRAGVANPSAVRVRAIAGSHSSSTASSANAKPCSPGVRRQAPPADLDAGRQVALGRVAGRLGQREQRTQGVDRGPARVGLAERRR